MTGTEIGEFRDTIVSLHGKNGINIVGCFPLTDALIAEGYRKESNIVRDILTVAAGVLSAKGIYIQDSDIRKIQEEYMGGRK